MRRSRAKLSLWQEVVVYSKVCSEFMVIAAVDDPDVLPAIAGSPLQVLPVSRNASKSSTQRRRRASRSVSAQLAEMLARVASPKTVHHEPLDVHCWGAASLPGEREVVLAFALSAADRADLGWHLPPNLLEAAKVRMKRLLSYKTRCAAMQALGMSVGATVEPPVESGVGALLRLFPPGLVFDVAPDANAGEAIAAKIRSAVDVMHPPPREGVYFAALSSSKAGTKAWVTWKPHAGAPSYGEIRAAAERSLPSSFASPRVTLISRSVLDPEHQAVAATIQSAPSFDPSNLNWSEAFGDHWHLDRQDDHLAGSTQGQAASAASPLSWYMPFHTTDEAKWGIYVDATRMDAYTRAICQDLREGAWSGSADALAARLVVGFVHQRELFHARCEAVLTWVELLAGTPRFLRYEQHVLGPARLAGRSLQDALASHWAWVWLSTESVMSVLAGQMSQEDRTCLEQVVETRLDHESRGGLSWRLGRDVAQWRRLATQLVRGRAGLASPGLGLPLETFLRDAKLPFEFSGEDVPRYVVGSGQVMRQLDAALALRRTPGRAELRRVLTDRFDYVVMPREAENGYEQFKGPDGRKFQLTRRTPLARSVFEAFLHHFELSEADYRAGCALAVHEPA